jgi:hypothetical protein
LKRGYVSAPVPTPTRGRTTWPPRDTALAGGAQFISTDWPDPRLGNGYRLDLPGAAAMFSPTLMAKRCAGMPIERQAPLGTQPPG